MVPERSEFIFNLKNKTPPRPSPNPTSPKHSQKQMLPINNIIPDLLNTLASQTTILLQAPPGAGKTTRVPLALMDAPWREDRKILMLEPRRLAARSAARYMAGWWRWLLERCLRFLCLCLEVLAGLIVRVQERGGGIFFLGNGTRCAQTPIPGG